MTKKEKKVYWAICAVIIIILIALFAKSRPSNEGPQSGNPSGNNSSTNNNQPGGSAEANTLSGTLMTSDNSVKGNLMLDTGEKKIYLQTSRDFSALIGKKVVMEYQGTLSGFTIKNISAAK